MATDPGRVSKIWRSSRTRNFTGGQTALADFMEKTMGQGDALTKLIVPDPVKSEMRVGHLELIIQSCPKLTYVDLSGCLRIKDFSSLVYLEDTLTHLNLSLTRFRDKNFKNLARLTSVTHLILKDNVEISGVNLEYLVGLPLTHLDLSHTYIRGSYLDILAPLGATLTHLILRSCPYLSTRGRRGRGYINLAPFLKHFNRLIHLDLNGNLIKKADLVILLSDLPSLSDLDLSDCAYHQSEFKMEECKRYPDKEAIGQLRSLLQE